MQVLSINFMAIYKRETFARSIMAVTDVGLLVRSIWVERGGNIDISLNETIAKMNC